MIRPLRIALVVDPFTLRMKWGEHAPALARELLGRGHTVHGFGAPADMIPRSGFNGAEPGDGIAGLFRFQPEAIIAYDAMSPAAFLGAKAARVRQVPLVLVEAAVGTPEGRSRILDWAGRMMWGRSVRSATSQMFALDALALRHALATGFPREIVRILPGGVDPIAYRPGLASGLILRHHIRGRILLYVGQLDASRGLDTLIRAYARTVGQRVDWSLVLAGDGPDRSLLRALVDRLGIGSSVHWLSSPREEELPGLLSASTLFAVPAIDESVRGKNIPRALSAGLPVLASDLENLHVFVEEDVTGLLVKPGDVEAWGEAIRRAASAPETRRRWSLAARRIVEERLGWPMIAAEFEGAIHADSGVALPTDTVVAHGQCPDLEVR